MATARTLKRWSGHGARVNAVEFGGTEGSVVVTGTSVSHGRPGNQEIDPRLAIYIERGRLISTDATGSYDATVRLWDTKSQSTKPIQILDEARDSISTLSILEHEIISGSVDGRVRSYDMRMGMVHVDFIGRISPTFTHLQPKSLIHANTISQAPTQVH